MFVDRGWGHQVDEQCSKDRGSNCCSCAHMGIIMVCLQDSFALYTADSICRYAVFTWRIVACDLLDSTLEEDQLA